MPELFIHSFKKHWPNTCMHMLVRQCCAIRGHERMNKDQSLCHKNDAQNPV